MNNLFPKLESTGELVDRIKKAEAERDEMIRRNALLRTRPDCINIEKAAEWYRGASVEDRVRFLETIGIL
jgi:hypothetical protein